MKLKRKGHDSGTNWQGPSLSRLISSWDRPLLIIVTLLLLIGLLMVFSATMFYAPDGGSRPDPLGTMMNHYLMIIVGVIIGILASLIPDSWYRNPHLLMVGLTVLMVLLVIVHFFGQEVNGARAWLPPIAGLSFQPSEFAKIGFCLSWAWIFDHILRERILSKEVGQVNYILALGFLMVINGVLIFIQPDLGMTAIILGMLLLMFLVFMNSKRWTLTTLAVLMGLFLFGNSLGQPVFDFLKQSSLRGMHLVQRIIAFIDPFEVAQDEGFQIVNGYLAFSRGGWFGQGIGQGQAKLGSAGFIPSIHNDYIFANIVEELGFIGGVVVLGLLLALVVRLLMLAARPSNDRFGRFVIVGVASLFFVQTFANIGGVLGLVPLTGVTLPFVSYGGTSMLVNLLALFLAMKFASPASTPKHQVSLVYSRKEGD
ncbi:FtsW/RodA/SpoVE family cell cycle protein [Hutsoniella sourekii]